MVEILKKFEKLLGTRVYAVGGCVRDHLLGRRCHDIDLASALLPEEVIARLSPTMSVYDVGQGAAHGTVIAILDGNKYEITTFRRDVETDGRHSKVAYTGALLEDLERRDFTINAMAMTAEGQLIEARTSESGVSDIKHGYIRCVGEPTHRFREDYLRIIRAARFAARYKFEIVPDTRFCMELYADQIPIHVSTERIKMEFDKAFEDENPDIFLEILDRTGVLKHILPEICRMRSFEHSPVHHPEGNVWQHTLKVVKVAPPEYRWQALFHDIGKTVDGIYRWDEEKQTHTYHAHDAIGPETVEPIAERLKFSNELKESCKTVAAMHMRPSYLIKGKASKKAIRRFILECGAHMEAVKHVVIADSIACRDWLNPNHEKHWSPKFEEDLEEEKSSIDPFVMGRDLIALGVSPGVEMGKMLKDIFDKQINGELETREDALNYAKTLAEKG